MSVLTLNHDWVNPWGTELPDGSFVVATLKCGDDIQAVVFDEPVAQSKDLEGEGSCILLTDSLSSHIDTESTCATVVHLDQDVTCDLSSVYFHENVPMLSLGGMGFLALGFIALGFLAYRMKF
jgi:hypothetical protein